MKPPKYDGTSAFETFYAQFLIVPSITSAWTKTDQLAHLKALQKEAGQVLWDYGLDRSDGLLSPVYTIQPVVKSVVKPV